jgi:hypothetical protein
MTAGNPEPSPAALPFGGRPAESPAAPPAVPLKGWSWMTGGMLALVLGILWTSQGLDLAEANDSVMSGKTIFAVAGVVLAVAGLALIVVGARIRGRFRRELLAAEQNAPS